MKTKLHILFIIALSLVWLILSADAAASDWFVRPAGGNYGKEDGSSYQDAWDGLPNVVWGAGGVEAGDTLYICGLHLRTRTGGSIWKIFTPGASGTGEESRIVIRGDYPGDPGIVWGAGIMAWADYVDEGDNVWSIVLDTTTISKWYFEDITADTWTILDKVSSLEECKATPGSHYSPDYSTGSKIYVHCSDSGNPTGRIAGNRFGYHVVQNDMVETSYTTWLNLKFYSLYRFTELNTTPMSYIRWENCTIWYGETANLFIRGSKHHIEIINCDLAWAQGSGIGIQEYPTGSGNVPHHIVIRGCKIHDIGVRYGDSDAHGIGGNSLKDCLIERNEIYNCGSGITFYQYKASTGMTDNIIRWNYIHDMHTIPDAQGVSPNSRGIEFNCDGGDTHDKSGNECYGNIVANVVSVGYRCTWAEYAVPFYNNVAYKCGTSFRVTNSVQDIGPNAKLRNNISLYAGLHIHFGTGTGVTNYIIDSDYNIFYPVSGYDFALNGYKTFAEWQAHSNPGCTTDPHSILADPLFVDPENGNFHLRPNSPAIDAGIDVGLTKDFSGKPIPQGVAFDIGAYEYAPPAVFLYGDVSGDSEISAYDAALTAQAAVELITLTADQTKAADVSGDSEVSAYDAALIAQRAVGLIEKFPVEG